MGSNGIRNFWSCCCIVDIVERNTNQNCMFLLRTTRFFGKIKKAEYRGCGILCELLQIKKGVIIFEIKYYT